MPEETQPQTIEEIRADLVTERYMRERNQLIIDEKNDEISYLKKVISELRDENLFMRQRIEELVKR